MFKAELIGLSSATELLRGESQVQSLTIRVDSQAMIRTTGHGRAIPGQYLVEAFHKQIAAVQTIHPGIEIKLRWMPGHAGIPGNEQAVEEAKGVAKGQLNERRRLPMVCRGEMPCIRSAAQQGHRKMVNNKAKKWFKHSPRCQRLWGIDPSMPSPRFRRDTQGLEHWKASLLIQLRTRHVPLQAHLCRIGKRSRQHALSVTRQMRQLATISLHAWHSQFREDTWKDT